MSYQNLLYFADGGVATITINRPDKMNALNRQTVNEIGEAVKQANADTNVKMILVTGAGPKAFVAGADISEFSSISVAQGSEFAANGHRVFNSIEQSPKPVIAAVNGFALGGGCELAMACHIRVASDNAKFGQPEVNLGLIPGYGGTQRLVQHIGKGKALELMMTGDMINASDALALGLVNYVVKPEELMGKCKELAEKIMSKSPVAVGQVIRCVNAYYTECVDGFKTEVDEFGKCFGTEDCKEGTTAFLEKRKPVFPGR